MIRKRNIIDLGNAVNRDHPLNRGRFAWYLSLPGVSAGGRFPDLMARNHAVLANAPTWSGTTRRGGYGQIANATGNNFGGVSSLLFPSGAFSFAWSAFSESANNSHVAASTASSFGGPFRSSATGFWLDSAGNAAVTVSNYFPSDDGLWHRYCWTFGGTGTSQAYAAYRDGVLIASGTSSASFSVPAITQLYLGGANTTGYRWNSPLDDFSLWSRSLGAGEVVADCEQSKRGHPDALNWLPARAWSIPAASGAALRRRILTRAA